MDNISQMGVLVLLHNMQDGNCNIIHYVSMKTKRVAKSVVAAELFPFENGFDLGFYVGDSIQSLTGR